MRRDSAQGEARAHRRSVWGFNDWTVLVELVEALREFEEIFTHLPHKHVRQEGQ